MMFSIWVSHYPPPPLPTLSQTGVRKVSCFPGAEEVGSPAPATAFSQYLSLFPFICLIYFFVSIMWILWQWCTRIQVITQLHAMCIKRWRSPDTQLVPDMILICLLVLNFPILKLLLTSNFSSQEYKFTLMVTVFSRLSPLFPLSLLSFLSFSSRLCWERKKTVAKKLGMKRKSKRVVVMSCVRRRETASLITTLLVPVTTRRKVPPYWGGWLDRLPFCPVTDTLHMCHSGGPVTSPQQRRWDREKGTGKRKATRALAPTTLSACLSPRIKIDIGRPSCCLFPANFHCFWRR